MIAKKHASYERRGREASESKDMHSYHSIIRDVQTRERYPSSVIKISDKYSSCSFCPTIQTFEHAVLSPSFFRFSYLPFLSLCVPSLLMKVEQPHVGIAQELVRPTAEVAVGVCEKGRRSPSFLYSVEDERRRFAFHSPWRRPFFTIRMRIGLPFFVLKVFRPEMQPFEQCTTLYDIQVFFYYCM